MADTQHFDFLPIHTAARFGNVREVEEYLAKGIDVDIADETGMTALMHAAHVHQLPVVLLLLRRGADPDRKEKKAYGGAVALMFAANNWDLEMVKVLIEYNADVNIRDAWNHSAVFYAHRREAKELEAYLEKEMSKK